MPKMPPRPCTKPGCTKYATKKGRCDDHQVKGWVGKGSGASRGYGYAWGRLKEKILRRDGYLCQISLEKGRVVAATEVDHIVPKSKGGTDDPENLRAVSKHEHDLKTKREAKEGRRR